MAAIETDKALTELESAAEGTVLKLLGENGDIIEVGKVIAYIGEAGESLPETAPPSSGKAEEKPTAFRKQVTGSPRVSPLVRNLAEKKGIDLARLKGSGPGGTISRQDVLAAADVARDEPSAILSALPPHQASVAKAVTISCREIPQFRVSASIDMTAAMILRKRSKTTSRAITYDAMFLSAMASAIREVPDMAVGWQNDRLVRQEHVHLAISIDVDQRLYLPVLRDVDTSNLADIQQDISRLTLEAHDRRLALEDMQGAFLALSNLGMYPIDSFDAIIFPGHIGILSLGAIQYRPIVSDDDNTIDVRPQLTGQLTVDHRLVNGRLASAYLTKVKDLVEGITLDSTFVE